MLPFELIEPTSIADAVRLLDPDDPTIRPMGGGTALMLMMKAGVFRPTTLVSLRKVEPDCFNISEVSDGLEIGALVTLGALERSSLVAKNAPLIIRTLATLSNVRVRNVATVGGALAHGDPHMDLPPVLMALGATLKIVSPFGERTLPIEDLFVGYYETSLQKNEIICSIRVPNQASRRGKYIKVTTGSADDWPALGVAVVVEGDEGQVRSARIVASAATDRAIRLKDAEAILTNSVPSARVLKEVADAAIHQADIIADVRGSASYKRELMRVYVRRAILGAIKEGTEQ